MAEAKVFSPRDSGSEWFGKTLTLAMLGGLLYVFMVPEIVDAHADLQLATKDYNIAFADKATPNGTIQDLLAAKGAAEGRFWRDVLVFLGAGVGMGMAYPRRKTDTRGWYD